MSFKNVAPSAKTHQTNLTIPNWCFLGLPKAQSSAAQNFCPGQKCAQAAATGFCTVWEVQELNAQRILLIKIRLESLHKQFSSFTTTLCTDCTTGGAPVINSQSLEGSIAGLGKLQFETIWSQNICIIYMQIFPHMKRMGWISSHSLDPAPACQAKNSQHESQHQAELE